MTTYLLSAIFFFLNSSLVSLSLMNTCKVWKCVLKKKKTKKTNPQWGNVLFFPTLLSVSTTYPSEVVQICVGHFSVQMSVSCSWSFSLSANWQAFDRSLIFLKSFVENQSLKDTSTGYISMKFIFLHIFYFLWLRFEPVLEY